MATPVDWSRKTEDDLQPLDVQLTRGKDDTVIDSTGILIGDYAIRITKRGSVVPISLSGVLTYITQATTQLRFQPADGDFNVPAGTYRVEWIRTSTSLQETFPHKGFKILELNTPATDENSG